MKKTFMSTLMILGALAATDALAQGPAYIDEYGREFRPPSETGRTSRPARPQRPADRDDLEARAQRRVVSPAAFDGAWSVAINTRSGACEPSYRFGVQIINGNVVYEGRATGRVAPNGAVRVSIAQGDQQANGQGHLSLSHGTGVWRGYGSAGPCAGTWQAVRRDY
jgi:hypothetical protein